MASSSSSSSSNKISEDKIRKAVKALLKWKNLQIEQQQQQQQQHEADDDDDDVDDDFMYLLLTLNKIPPKQETHLMIPHKIPLPHPLHPFQSQPNICLIIGDGPKNKSSNQTKLTIEAAQKKIKSEDIPITMVMKLSKIKSDYNSFEAKRKLCDSYDLFLADKRVVHLLPKVLGKQFYKNKRKVPVPVDLKSYTSMSWKEEVEKACSSALLCFGNGTCCVVRIGKWGFMESAQIVDNVLAAINGIVEVVPKNWAGVRAFHLKFSESLALPIYNLNSKIDDGIKPKKDHSVDDDVDKKTKTRS